MKDENESMRDTFPKALQNSGYMCNSDKYSFCMNIRMMPENQKTAFTLNKIEGLSYDEIGEIMHTTLPSIKSLIHRARENLRSYLRDYYTNKD